MKILDLQIFRLSQRYPHGKIIDAVLVFVKTDEGFIGFGSAHHPIPDEFIEESLRFLREAKPAIIGMDPFDIEGILDVFSKVPARKNAARTAIDIACYDIIGKVKKKPIYQLLSGEPKPYTVPTAVAVYLHDDPIETTRTLMKKYMPNGLKILQIHVDSDANKAKQKIRNITKIFPGEITLSGGTRLKNKEKTVKFLKDVHEEFGDRILLIAQPSPYGDLDTLKHISDNSPIPVYAHGGIKTIQDIENMIDKKTVKGFWVHTYRMGGFYLCSRIAELINKNNLGIHIGNGGSCGITTTAGAHLAAGTKNVVVAVVIDDLKYPYLRIMTDETMPKLIDGARVPSTRPGLGLELKESVKQIIKGNIKISLEG